MSEPSENLPKEFITIGELAYRLTVKPKTIKNKMASGIFKKGLHYFSPKGLRPRFKWSAVVEWLEEKEEDTTQEDNGAIPMARGYYLGESPPEKKFG